MNITQITDPEGDRLQWAQFDGLTDLARLEESLPDHKRGPVGQSPFYGASRADSARFIREGNPALVEQSDRIMRELEGHMDFGAHIARTVPSVAGGAPCVPAYLSNSPLAMRQRRRVVTDLAPIAVIVNVGANSDVTASQIATRGAACLALVRLLSVSRPTTLILTAGYEDGRRSLVTVAMDTAPLDLARAAWALTQPEFLRHFIFAAATHAGQVASMEAFHGSPLMSQSLGTPEIVAGALGFTEYVASARLVGNEFQTQGAGAAWLLDSIKKLSALSD